MKWEHNSVISQQLTQLVTMVDFVSQQWSDYKTTQAISFLIQTKDELQVLKADCKLCRTKFFKFSRMLPGNSAAAGYPAHSCASAKKFSLYPLIRFQNVLLFTIIIVPYHLQSTAYK